MSLPAATTPRTRRRRLRPWRTAADGAARESGAVLVRDGLSLTISAGLTSVAGMVAWIAAARLLPRAEVGQASAFVSAFLLVAGLGDLGLRAALMRWVPRAGEHRRRLILRSYAVVVLASLVIAVVVLLLPTGDEIYESVPRFAGVAFVFAAVGWSLFQFQDTVLVSLGRASWVPYENASIGVARVLVLVALGPLLGTFGILVSWVVPAAIGVLVISLLVRRTLARAAIPLPGNGTGQLPDRAEILRMLVPVYPAKVFGSALSDLVPLLVVGRFGPTVGAVFFVVWMAGNAVDYTIGSFGQSVVVRIAHEPHRSAALFWLGCRRAALLFVPALLLGLLIAHPVLEVFGNGYAAHGETLLRLVLLGSIPRGFVSIVVALNLAHGNGMVVGLLEAVSAIGVVGLVAVAPIHHGLLLIGYGFVGVQLLVALAALVLLFWQPPGFRVAQVNWTEPHR